MLCCCARVPQIHPMPVEAGEPGIETISHLFPRAYLEQIGNFPHAVALARLESRDLSPIGIPAGMRVPYELFSAYMGASQRLLKRDVLLCDFFKRFLQAQGYPEPFFMGEPLEVAEKAMRIRADMAENRYELRIVKIPLKKLEGGRVIVPEHVFAKEIPPEAIAYLQMTDEQAKELYRYCMRNFQQDTWWRLEAIFAFFDQGKFPMLEAQVPKFWAQMPYYVFEEAMRTHRNAFARAFLRGGDLSLGRLAHWSVLAAKYQNEEVMEQLREKREEMLSKMNPLQRGCCSLNIWCGCRNDEIYGPQEAGLFLQEPIQFRRFEPLEWAGIRVPDFGARHARFHGAAAELEMLQEAFSEESEYLEHLAAPTGLFSSERAIALSDLNRHLAFAHEKALALGKETEKEMEIPAAAELFPDLYRDYFRAIVELKKRDQALVQFFEDFLQGFRLPNPPCMREEGLAKKANGIREEMMVQNYTLTECSVGWETGGGWHYFDPADNFHVRSRHYPPEIAYLRMEGKVYISLVKHCDRNNYDETLFALIESGKLEHFSSWRFINRFGELRAWIDIHANGLKKVLFKAVRYNRTASIEILLRVLDKKMTHADWKKCRELAS